MEAISGKHGPAKQATLDITNMIAAAAVNELRITPSFRLIAKYRLCTDGVLT
ncbi:MAG: hypothetical protein WCA56_10230 [Xanthobacteraceae bacterium]